MTAIMLCDRTGSVEYKEKRKITREKINTFKSIMLRQFPLSFVDLLYLMFPQLISEEDDYFWTLCVTAVSPRQISLHTYTFLVFLGTANGSVQKRYIYI